MEITDEELDVKCMNILIDQVGHVDAERFVSNVNRNRFDYTEWQKGLFVGDTVRSLCEKVKAFEA